MRRVRPDAGTSIQSQRGSKNRMRSWRKPASDPKSTDVATARRAVPPRASRNARTRTVVSVASRMYGIATSPCSQTSGDAAKDVLSRTASQRDPKRRQRRYRAATATPLATTLTATRAWSLSKPKAFATAADAT